MLYYEYRANRALDTYIDNIIFDKSLSCWSDDRAQCTNYSKIMGTTDIQLHNAGSHHFHTFIHIYIIDIILMAVIIRMSILTLCNINILLIIALIHFARVLKITE